MKRSIWLGAIGLLTVGVLLAVGVAAFTFRGSLAAVLQQVTGTPAAPGGPRNAGQYQQTFLQNLANRLKITEEALKAAITGAAGDTLDQAVKDGRITQQQADKLKQNFQNGDFGPGLFPFGFDRRGPRGKMGFEAGQRGVGVNEFAAAMNLTAQDLMTELKAGKTINDVIKEKGLDAAQVKQAVLDAVKQQLDQAVTSGRLTQAQADQEYQEMSSRMDALMSQDWGMGLKGEPGLPGLPGHGGMLRLGVDEFARAMNMTAADLTTELQAGKTINDVIKEKALDAAQVKQAVLADIKAQLDQMVSSQRMTQAQEDQMLQNLGTKLDALMSQAWKGMNGGWRDLKPGQKNHQPNVPATAQPTI